MSPVTPQSGYRISRAGGTAGAVRPQAPLAAAMKRPPAQSGGPQFGMSVGRTVTRTLTGAYDRLVPVFTSINEKFFWGFISLDILGLWPGRFITGLLAGRKDKDYDPRKDPAAMNLPYPQQVKHWIGKQWQGLNWPNCWEEVKREVIVAPGGILFVPSLVFVVGRQFLGRIVEIRFKTLHRLAKSFTEKLKAHPAAAEGARFSKADYKKAVANHMAGLFADPLLQSTPIDDPKLRDALKALNPGKEPTYGDFLRNRFEAWSEHLFDPALEQKTPFYARGLRKLFKPENPLADKLEALSDEIKGQLMAFNRKHRMAPYEFMRDDIKAPAVVTDPMLLSDHAWIIMNKGHDPKPQALSGVLSDLRKWSEFPKMLWDKVGSAKALSASAVAEASETLAQKIIARKGLITVALMAIASTWLVRLTRFAQSSDAYQATRNLHKSPAGDSNGQPSAPAAPSFPQPQPFSLNAFPGAQPFMPAAPTNPGGRRP